jgi:hypothetical protein
MRQIHPDLCRLGLDNTMEGEVQGVVSQVARLVQVAAKATAAAAAKKSTLCELA